MKRSDYLVDTPFEKGMPYAELLRLAMKREEKSLKLYNDLAKKTDDKELVKTFQMLHQKQLFSEKMPGHGIISHAHFAAPSNGAL